MIGSIAAIERGLVVVPQVFGAVLFVNRRKRKQRLVVWHLVLVIPFLFINAAILYFAESQSQAFTRWGLLLGFSGYIVGMGCIISVWLDWIAHLFKTSIRGTVMGLAFFALSFASTGGSLLAGWILETLPGNRSFLLLYLGAGIVAIISILIHWLIDDPAESADDSVNQLAAIDVWQSFRLSLKDVNFRQYLFGRILAAPGFSIVPFIAVFYQSLSGGALNDATIVASGAAMTFGTALANLLLGRMGDTYGHRIGIIAGTAFQVLALVIMLMSTGAMSCIMAYFCIGITGSSAFISHNNMMFETCTHDNRSAHIAVGNLLVYLPLLVIPVLAGTVAKTWGLRTLFALSLISSIISVAWFILLVKEPRRIHAFSSE
ncbi:MFS transporter [candidate division KSB1 bacterium]|nr:MFS transporter [candidate division KSB1 bacterium]